MEGKWELTVHTYMGDMRSNMEYHVEGNVLTASDARESVALLCAERKSAQADRTIKV